MSSEKTRNNGIQAPEYGGEIRARIIDAENGFRLISGVYAVRLRDREYSLLIMEDYLPTLGKVDGDIVFLTDTGEVPLKGIKGFYKHQHNEFTLILETEMSKRAAAEAESGDGGDDQ